MQDRSNIEFYFSYLQLFRDIESKFSSNIVDDI